MCYVIFTFFRNTCFQVFFLFMIITIKHAILSVKYALFCPQGALLPICIFSPFKSRRWSCCCCTLMQLVVLRHLPYYIMMNRICRQSLKNQTDNITYSQLHSWVHYPKEILSGHKHRNQQKSITKNFQVKLRQTHKTLQNHSDELLGHIETF